MKLSYIIPTTSYSFFGEIVPWFEDAGIEVLVNNIADDTELILAAILPCTPAYGPIIAGSKKPYILWHWDDYSFVDMRQARWQQFWSMLRYAVDVWSCGYETARLLKEQRGVDSIVLPAWVNSRNFVQADQLDFVYYASSSGAFGKRVDWAVEACKLCDYPLILTSSRRRGGGFDTREEYLRKIASCRVYLMTAFEESNATIPAMEAGANGRPVVLADIPSSREVFGDTGYYFRNDDFRSLLTQLRRAWYNRGPASYNCRERILANYDLPVVADRIIKRIKQVYDTYNTCKPTIAR